MSRDLLSRISFFSIFQRSKAKVVSRYSSDYQSPMPFIASGISERTEFYSELLGIYVDISKWRLRLKEIHKWLLFWIMIAFGGIVLWFVYRTISPILSTNDAEKIVSAMPVLITAFVSLLSSSIAIPLAITNFLFNTNEDNNITTIIKHTQEHDADSAKLLLSSRPSASEIIATTPFTQTSSDNSDQNVSSNQENQS